MLSTDLTEPRDLPRIRARARWAYERGRLQRALLGVAPLSLTVAIATCVAVRPETAAGLGVAAVLLGTLMLWYGRDPKRAFIWGAAAGIIPLVLAIVASHVHACGAEGCTNWCVPACSGGGVLAGGLVAFQGYKRRAGRWFLISASALALLVGSMGCSCIGASGVIGLMLGFGFGVAPGILKRR